MKKKYLFKRLIAMFVLGVITVSTSVPAMAKTGTNEMNEGSAEDDDMMEEISETNASEEGLGDSLKEEKLIEENSKLEEESGILDVTPPDIKGIQLSATNVEAGGSIEITADVTDDISGVADPIFISFENEDYQQDLTTWLYYNGDYDSEGQKEFNDGKWHGILHINQYGKPGDYIISRVSVGDNAGNHSDTVPDSIKDIKFTIVNNGTIDTTAPVINDIRLSAANVEAGGSIEITADVTDDISGVADPIFISFENEDYQQDLTTWLYYNGDYDSEGQKEFNDGKWHGILHINQYGKPGDYIISRVSVRDNAENHSDMVPDSIKDVKFTVINNGTVDTTAPVIKELTFGKTSVDAPGYFEVVADISDDASGVDYAHISFKNVTYGHTLDLWLYNTYYDTVSGQKKEYSDGKWHGEMHINQYGRPGDYVMSNMHIKDKAGNYSWEVPDEFKSKRFTVLNDGTGVDAITGTNSSDYIDVIAGAADDSLILIDYSNESNVQAGVFDAIKGTNKQVVFENDGYQWVVNGNDITGESKAVNLSIHTYALVNGYSGADQALADTIGEKSAMVFDFAENGILPGKMTIRIKADYALREYVGVTGIYVYYYDTSTGKLEPIASDISLTSDYYFEFSIEHCSEYILTQGAIQETSIDLTDGNQSSVNDTNSNEQSGGTDSEQDIPESFDTWKSKEGVEGFVYRLYNVALSRDAEEAGLADWMNRLNSKKENAAQVAWGIFFSEEFQNKNYTDAQYIEMLYKTMFGRSSDNEGKQYWLSCLENGASREYVYHGFAESEEFSNLCNTFGVERGNVTLGQYRDRNMQATGFIARLYTKMLGRRFDDDGLEYWCRKYYTRENTIEEIATVGFLHSQELQNLNLSDEEFVRRMYQTFLNREPEEAGLQDWIGRLRRGEETRDSLVYGFTNSREFANLKKEYNLP